MVDSMTQSYTIGLWRKEWSVTRGWQWIKQRDCARESAQDWLDCYLADDPNGQYMISERRPK